VTVPARYKIGELTVPEHPGVYIVVTAGARIPPIRNLANPQNFSSEFFENSFGFADSLK
jgi:hypothetical protein